MTKLSTVNDIVVKNNNHIQSRGSDIFVFEDINFLFLIKRIFVINNKNFLDPRGGHAHKNNDQIISCINGKINLKMTDSKNNRSIDLFNSNFLVYVPKGIWSDIIFIDKYSTVVCYSSENYDESSYIRNYDDFIDYKNN